MSALVIGGDVSGTVTLQAPSAAGSTVLTLPATSGTLVTTAGGTASSATNLAGGSAGTIPYQSASDTTAMLAAGTSGQFLTSTGSSAPIWSTLNLSNVTQSVINTSTAAVAGTYYTLTASLTLTLPASPTAGDFVAFSNISGTTTCVIARNSSNIMALAEDLTLDSAQARGTLVYTGATNGWVLVNN